MKQFVIKFLIFSSLFITFLVVGLFTEYKLLNNPRNYILSGKIKFMILGHSQTVSAFNDSLISHSVNLASSGETYFYTYLKVRQIIPNNKNIKVVFMEFTNNTIQKSADSRTWGDYYLQLRFPVYFPLFEYSDFRFICEKNPKAILRCLPKSLIQNAEYTYLTTVSKKRMGYRFGGYHYLVRDKTDSLINNMPLNNLKENVTGEIAKTNIEYLSKTIEFCILNHVKVFLIRSPLHSKYPALSNEPQFREFLSSKFSTIEFLDFKDFPLQNSEFGDLFHLNHKGARIFSIFFNSLLDSSLLDKNNKQEFINTEISKLVDAKYLSQTKIEKLTVKN